MPAPASSPHDDADTTPGSAGAGGHPARGRFAAWKPGWKHVTAAAVCAGILLRVREVAAQRSLWVDESMLALNVVTRDFTELARPLDQVQMAPLFFLWAARAGVTLLGQAEWVFRLLPLASGAALLVVMALLLSRVAGAPTVATVVSCLSISPFLIYYSGEFKPYMGDALASAVVLWVFLREGEGVGRRPWLPWLVATLVPWFSLPVAFTLGGIVLANGWRNRRASLPVIAGAVSWVAAVLATRSGAVSRAMSTYWTGGFVSTLADARRAGDTLVELAAATVQYGERNVLPTSYTYAVVLGASMLAVLGWVTGVRQRNRWAVASAGIACAGLGAALLRQYPVSLRLWCFCLPAIAIGQALGLSRVAAGLSLGRSGPFLLGLIVLVPSLRSTLWFARHPEMVEHARPVISRLRERRGGEPVYVYARATPAYLLYASSARPQEVTRRIMSLASPPGAAFMNLREFRPAMPEEARGLADRTPEGVDVFGAGSGVNIAFGGVGSHPVADPRWAPQEVGRIMDAVTTGCFWTFESHVMPEESAALGAAVLAHGYTAQDSIVGGGAAHRYCRATEGR